MATAVDVVHEFWRLMATNDFRSVGRVLATDFVVEWPQTRERIRGAEPANGPWRFSINRLIGGETEAVSDVTVSDGVR
ncbi:MAG TPA: nuclear transport factor 2 family protein, partial [Burkholderiales bacterium]|nr:nuclear transport factor 2 family protein [Burkholderiales bacterium]